MSCDCFSINLNFKKMNSTIQHCAKIMSWGYSTIKNPKIAFSYKASGAHSLLKSTNESTSLNFMQIRSGRIKFWTCMRKLRLQKERLFSVFLLIDRKTAVSIFFSVFMPIENTNIISDRFRCNLLTCYVT